MLLTLLIITWLVLGTMAATSLFYKNYHDNQILGATLSRVHAATPETRKIVRDYKTACYLTFLIFLGLSFLMLAKGIWAYAEFYMLLLVLADLFAHWRIYDAYQQKLLALKRKNGWSYPRNKVLTVDINVAREKGKAGIASVWVWLFLLLSFMPTVYSVIHTRVREAYPVVLSLIGPLCQLLMIFLYYSMRKRHAPALSDDTEINKACARTEERVNTTAATLSALATLLFWFLFNCDILFFQTGWLVVASVVMMIVFMLATARRHQKKISDTENRFFGEKVPEETGIPRQKPVWKWGFYDNPSDPRVFVPKRIASMGWTINIGTPPGKVLGIAMIVLLLAIPATLLFASAKDYSFTCDGSEITIDAAMYDTDIGLDQIVSVTTIDALPGGTRTNGYGGLDKSFGHFSLEGYGKCMLYVYNDVDLYVVLGLKGGDPAYVIVNDKSPELTEGLYRTVAEWIKGRRGS